MSAYRVRVHERLGGGGVVLHHQSLCCVQVYPQLKGAFISLSLELARRVQHADEAAHPVARRAQITDCCAVVPFFDSSLSSRGRTAGREAHLQPRTLCHRALRVISRSVFRFRRSPNGSTGFFLPLHRSELFTVAVKRPIAHDVGCRG